MFARTENGTTTQALGLEPSRPTVISAGSLRLLLLLLVRRAKMDDFVQNFFSLISKYRFSLETEDALKLQMAEVLTQSGIPFEKEYKLDEKNKLDFFIYEHAVEVKIKGSAKSIYRQCVRYCEFAQVKGLFLVTNKSLGFPESINGKPCYVLNLGKSWL